MSATAASSQEVESPLTTPSTASGPGADSGSADRMAELRRLVRDEGKSADEAAQVVGVDPIVAQLWLRLPDDLWQGTPSSSSMTGISSGPGATLPPVTLSTGLRRVVTCRVPSPAYDRLRSGDTPVLEAAGTALETGLALPLPDRAPGGWRFTRRPLAVPVSAAAFHAIGLLAADHFNCDVREAAGWLIARGLGMALPLPTSEELAGVFLERSTTQTPLQPVQGPAPARFVLPPRRRPESRAPLPPDDSAPSGDELRQRREEVGISQRDLAAASGLSRGLVAEIERGRRRHVLTRLRLAETLASLARSK
jgi:DNA-binding XRE family transcriptional regulator